MKVALCTAGELWGGIETFVLSYAKKLSERKGIELICFLFEEGLLSSALEKNGVRVEIIPLKHKHDLTAIRRAAALFKKEKVEVVHTNGYKANILCGLSAKWSGMKLVKTEHGMLESAEGTPLAKMWLNVKIDNFLSRFLYDAAVFVSKDLERANRGFYRKIESEVIYNGIDVPKRREGEKVERVLTQADRFQLCLIGRLTPVKGHIYLLKALEQLRDLKNITLYFLGEGELEAVLKAYCRENSILDKVFFMGFQANVADYLKEMDAVVMPSLHEGIPYTMLEAMAHDVPIVASRVGGMAEILTHEVDALLVPPRDETSLALAIRCLYEDQKLRDRLAENAYRKVSNELVSDQMVDRYLELYRKI